MSGIYVGQTVKIRGFEDGYPSEPEEVEAEVTKLIEVTNERTGEVLVTHIELAHRIDQPVQTVTLEFIAKKEGDR